MNKKFIINLKNYGSKNLNYTFQIEKKIKLFSSWFAFDNYKDFYNKHGFLFIPGDDYQQNRKYNKLNSDLAIDFFATNRKDMLGSIEVVK